MGSLREAPATVPALAAVVLFLVWATSQAGYPLTHWTPGALIVLALLAMAVLAVPLSLAEIPLSVKIAVGCLAGYTVLSYLSIVWAAAPAAAWEGANRTLLYLMVFALFALWRGRSTSAALLVGAWTLAMVGLAVYVAVRLDGAGGGSFDALFTEERLSYPVGYPNAAAAQWLMAFWPALLFARGRSLPWGLRGLLAGGAVVLADVALFSQSRGSFYSLVPMLVLVFAFVPNRLRTFAVAVPVAVGVAATAPLVLRVGERLEKGQSTSSAVHSAIVAMFLAAVLVGIVVGLVAAVESRRALSPRLARGVRRGVAALAVATLVVVLVGGVVAAGHGERGSGVGGKLVTRVRHSWESFEGGYATSNSGGNRLVSGLGSNRYDFYRVALHEFAAHPVLGIGADNYQQQYLRIGRSNETPRYPHSVELRTLTQTGLVGALLAVVGLAAALVAGWQAMRRADPLGRTVAAAALGGFAYWIVHGSFDWFWEFAGLASPAFALLGVACSLAPARGSWALKQGGALRSSADGLARPRGVVIGSGGEGASGNVGGGALGGDVSGRALGGDVSGRAFGGGPARAREGRRSEGRRSGRIAAASLAGLLPLAAVISLAAPWLSERQVQSAARIWPKAPLVAYSRLEDAAKLNPLSDRPYLVAGSIALRFDDLSRARQEFSLALERAPDDAYAALELGAIASESGERERARALLERAVRLHPRDPLTRRALLVVGSGGRVSVGALNRSILSRAQHLL
jgi:O-Antigen ligase